MRGRGGSIYTLDGGAGGVVLDGDTRWEGAREGGCGKVRGR